MQGLGHTNQGRGLRWGEVMHAHGCCAADIVIVVGRHVSRMACRHFNLDNNVHNKFSKHQHLMFCLQEFCNLARHLQPDHRNQLFSKLVQLGLFEQVTHIMTVGSDAVKLKATDILLSVMQHDTPALRNFLQKQPEHKLFGLLVRELGEGSGESGLAEQVSELLKIIMDPETLKQPVEKEGA